MCIFPFTLATDSLARLSFSSKADIFLWSSFCKLAVKFLSLLASCTALVTLARDSFARLTRCSRVKKRCHEKRKDIQQRIWHIRCAPGSHNGSCQEHATPLYFFHGFFIDRFIFRSNLL